MPVSTEYWHDSMCPGPKIQFEEHGPDCDIRDTCRLLLRCKLVPHCVACGRKPPLHDIISEHVNPSTFGAGPQDKPFGQLSLYWPSRSLYYSSTDSPTLEEATPKKAMHEQALSHVYPTTLRSDQFRQACLSPTDGENFKHAQSIVTDPEDLPVHLMLETYEDDNCPEYEAFSYTWEGEHPEQDNEISPCHPVYIGLSWDVIMQTRNCWELLRFARLPHITRHIWVDAICINQSNMKERTQQVAKMGRIYKDSLRVVVYLGPDMVTKPKHRFPRRHRLDQFASGEIRPMSSDGSIMDLDMEKLLARRYFTRLWVIQELILATKIVIRIGDTDFLVDPIITNKLKESQQWSLAKPKTTVPWFKHVTWQTLGTDPCSALELVSSANCSDFRDRLFGILGLMDPEDTIDRGVQANYSISSQHVWIGFFAHCLLRLNIFWFLPYAAGPRRSLGNQPLEPWIPSWVPDWTSMLTWQRFQKPRGTIYYDLGGEIRWGLTIDEPYPYDRTFWVDKLTLTRLVPRGDTEPRTRWNEGASVDPKTGILKNIRATRLLAITSMPRLQTRVGVHGVYEVDLCGMHWGTRQSSKDVLKDKQKLYLVSIKPLDRDILPLHDHLYVLETNQSLKFLILRDTGGHLRFLASRFGPGYFNMADHRNFSLIAAVPLTYLGFDPGMCKDLGLYSTKPTVAEVSIGRLPRLLTVRQLIDNIRNFLDQAIGVGFYSELPPISMSPKPLNEYFFLNREIKNFQTKISESVNYNFREDSDGLLDGEIRTYQIFPSGKNSDLLPIYWELANEVLIPEACSDEKLEKCYIASVNPRFQPIIQNRYVELRLEANDFRALPYSWRSDIDYYWQDCEWSYERLVWTKFGDRDRKLRLPSWERAVMVIYVRASLNQVLSTIRQSSLANGMVKCILWLREVFETDDLRELQKQLALPHERFSNFIVEKRDFAVDGQTRGINIQ
ncbi:heterokaryon incompatibility protein-domain-containing protein [Xylaria telfairii]|nr:heterokaryon incompatibility protein-domain-containing protein [Xylaria telfairii]